MAEYVYIENGVIVEYHDLLPKSWRHISGLNLLQGDTVELNKLGWYSVTKQPVQYDDATQYVSHYQYSIMDNSVIETPVVVDKPADQIPTAESIQAAFLTLLREERNRRLLETDWTALTDSPLSADKKLEFAAYRQILRNLPQRYQNVAINSLEQINWPTVPALP